MPEGFDIMSQATTPSMATAFIRPNAKVLSSRQRSQFAPPSQKNNYEVELVRERKRLPGRYPNFRQQMKDNRVMRSAKTKICREKLTPACLKKENKIRPLTRNDSN